jgi:hypothetical protein
MCVKLPLYMMCVRLTALLAYLQVPEGVDPAALIKNAMDKYELEIAGGLGPSAGKCFRIGVMGYNAKPQNMALVVEAFRDGGCVCECVREGGAPLLWRVCGLVLGCGLWIMGYNAKPHINHGAGGGGFQRRWVCEGDLCCKEGGGVSVLGSLAATECVHLMVDNGIRTAVRMLQGRTLVNVCRAWRMRFVMIN